MAYLFADGFDHYGTLTAMQQGGIWDQVALGPVTTHARTGSYALSVAQYSTARIIIPGTGDTFGVAHGAFFSSLPTASQEMPIQVWEALGSNLEYGRLTVDYQGTFRFYNSAGTVVAQSNVGACKTNLWLHIECKIHCNATTGTMALRVNEIPVMGAVNVVSTVAITGLKAVRFASPSPVYTFGWWMDDLCIWDNGDTSSNADWVGDQRLYLCPPTSDNNLGAWVPSSGSNGWSLLDNVPPDDTKWIASSNAGDYADFGIAPLPGSAQIITGVVVFGRLQKNTAGTCVTKIGINSGGNVALGPDFGPSTAWAYTFAMFNLDPHTGVAWTTASVNAAKVAVSRTA
jgi:hypothetical protein